jgi:hypothetical protein
MPLPLAQNGPTRSTVRRHATILAAVLTVACATPALAQKVTTVEELTLKQALGQLADPLTSRPTGEAIAFATALETATAPLATSSGGFVFKLDPSTGLLVRTATTFGPAFTERALTSGEGQVSVGATFSASTYNKLSDLPLSNLQLGTASASAAVNSRNGVANLGLTSKTVALSGIIGVTENFDVAVVVPMVSIKLAATSSLIRGDGVVARLAEGSGIFSGIGDVSGLAKYRFVKFRNGTLPDAGGVAAVVRMRLPTGDRDNLRGLGVYRTLVSVVASGGTGRIRPHGEAGFEYWSKGVDVRSGFTPGSVETARHQIQYAAGVEVEATPRVTLLVDFLGQQILGAGQLGTVVDTPAANALGITSVQSLAALGDGIHKALLAPGVKVNLKGKMLLSLNAIMTMKNNGLRATVTPVVGLNLTL